MGPNKPSFIVEGERYLITTVNDATSAVKCERVDPDNPSWIIVEPEDGREPYALNLVNVVAIIVNPEGRSGAIERGIINP